MNTATRRTRAPPTPAPLDSLDYTRIAVKLSIAGAELEYYDLFVSAIPDGDYVRVTMTQVDHGATSSEWSFTAYAIPTAREAETAVRAFRAAHDPHPGDHLALIFTPMTTADSASWRGRWTIEGSWSGGDKR